MTDEQRKAFAAETDKVMGVGWSAANPDVFKTMVSKEASRMMGKRQKLFDVAAEGGAQHGGPSIGDIGQKMPYGDTAMFNPKAMPPRYLPGTKPREEDELIPPGFAQFPYRMY